MLPVLTELAVVRGMVGLSLLLQLFACKQPGESAVVNGYGGWWKLGGAGSSRDRQDGGFVIHGAPRRGCCCSAVKPRPSGCMRLSSSACGLSGLASVMAPPRSGSSCCAFGASYLPSQCSCNALDICCFAFAMFHSCTLAKGVIGAFPWHRSTWGEAVAKLARCQRVIEIILSFSLPRDHAGSTAPGATLVFCTCNNFTCHLTHSL